MLDPSPPSTVPPPHLDFVEVPPAFDEPLDPEEVLAQVPDSARVKGFFVNSIEKLVQQGVPDGKRKLYEGLPRARYLPFQNYPRREIMLAELRCSQLLHPDLPLRQALRRASQRVYPVFLRSLFGRVMLGALGNDVNTILKLGPRAIGSMVSFGRIEAIHVGKRHWLYHYDGHYSWMNGEVGVIEGLLLHYGFRPRLRMAWPELFDMWLEIRWE